jgi:predicted ABC-type ATPase
MPKKPGAKKRIIIIAGPNGAGKTTLAEDFLRHEQGSPEFINADVIARGVSPLAPQNVSIQAGKIMLQEIRRRISRGESFAFETTLAGLNYSKYIPQWQKKGYRVKLIFLTLPSAEVALARVRFRVFQGGHGVPDEAVRRRFAAGLRNFEIIYRRLVNAWAIYDNSGESPLLKAMSTKS